jgi:sec-independent protein translocase protein TatC
MTDERQNERGQSEDQQPLMAHLTELRTRLLRSAASILVVLLVLIPFADPIYTWLSGPLTAHLPAGSQMIAIDVASPFLAPIKLVLMLSVIISVPIIAWQLWGFVAPGLYENERRFAAPLIISSTLLFYLGCAFAYYVVFPLVFGFFTSTAPAGVAVMTDINRYLDFVLVLLFAFGMAFEVPIATFLAVATGLATVEQLASWRAYIIVGAFTIGMLITPPDIISQTLLALPMWLLFEAGILLSRLLLPRLRPEEEQE